jgi:hypothetical protein
MRISYWLDRAVIISEYHGLSDPCRDDKRQNQNGDNKADKPSDTHDCHQQRLLAGRFFVLKIPWYQISIILIFGLMSLSACRPTSSSPARNS